MPYLSSAGIPLASGSKKAFWICFVCSSFQVSITFKVNICSFSFWRIYRTWPVSSDVTPVYQKMFKSVKPFMSYRPETIFLFLVTVTLTPPAPISNLICIFWCYTCVPKIVQIRLAFHELSSGNRFSFFSNSDLDLGPTSPNIKLDLYLLMLHLCTKLYLLMLHLCTKNCSNLSSLSWVIVRKPFFYF